MTHREEKPQRRTKEAHSPKKQNKSLEGASGEIIRPVKRLGDPNRILVLTHDFPFSLKMTEFALERDATLSFFWSFELLESIAAWDFHLAIIDEMQWFAIQEVAGARVKNNLNKLPIVIVSEGESDHSLLKSPNIKKIVDKHSGPQNLIEHSLELLETAQKALLSPETTVSGSS